jgi:hypothetical protein
MLGQMTSTAGTSTASDSTVTKKRAGFWWYRVSNRCSVVVCTSADAVRARRHISGISVRDAWAWVATASASSR